MTAPTVPTAPLPSELPPADYDKAYNRHYLPLPGGWEVQTKGNGSSFRIAGPEDFRLLIPDQPYVHETLERMARDIREAVLTMQRERDQHASVQAAMNDQAIADGEKITELREQLAASERTCAELGQEVITVRMKLVEAKEHEEAAERTVEGLMERADVEVCCAQAVEFAEYVTEHAKGKMVEAAQRFLSLPYSQELAAKLKRAPSA